MNAAPDQMIVALSDSQSASQVYKALLLGSISNSLLNILLTDEIAVQKTLTSEGLAFTAFDKFVPCSVERVVFKITEGRHKDSILVTDRIAGLSIDAKTHKCMLIDVHKNVITVTRAAK